MPHLIAIVGRPNVGKSTLFNRIAGRRKALVNDTYGVTRDRIYSKADWDGVSFQIVDTGGIVIKDKTGLEGAIRKQTLSAIDEADAIICVFDGREGPTFLDRNIVDILRKSGKKTLFAVNKLGEVKGHKAPNLSEFYGIGVAVEELFPVSSEHGIGVDALLDAAIEGLDKAPAEKKEESQALKVAVIGRPNAGKSTLVNYLAGQDRVIASEMPGTTRDSIDVDIKYEDKEYIFVDTAGLKRKGKTIETLDKYSAIKALDSIKKAEVILLLVDSNEGFTHQDSALLEYVYKEGKGIIVLFNKWDDLKTSEKVLLDFYEEKLFKLHRIRFLCISAKTGLNIGKVFKEIDSVVKALNTKLSTSELNEMLEDLKQSHNIPQYKGRPVKLYYITQMRVNPLSFLVFSNWPEGIAESYKRYLQNKIQDRIGDGIPMMICFRKKK